MKLARNIFFEALIFSREMLRNFPRNFWAFILWVQKNPRQISPKSKKIPETSFCRGGHAKKQFSKAFRTGCSCSNVRETRCGLPCVARTCAVHPGFWMGGGGPCVGFGKRGPLEKGSFQKSPFSRDSREFRDSRVSREISQTVENKGEPDHFLENLEILEILEIPPAQRPLS